MNGLDPVIRAKLLVNRPSGMGRILQMAQCIESKNKTLRQIKGVGHWGNKLEFLGENGGLRGPMSPTTGGTTPTEKSPGHRTEVQASGIVGSNFPRGRKCDRSQHRRRRGIGGSQGRGSSEG